MSQADPKLEDLVRTGNYLNLLNYINNTTNLNTYATDGNNGSMLYWAICQLMLLDSIRALIDS